MTQKQTILDLILLGVLCSILFTLFSGSYPYLTPDEARYFEVAREMVATGNYITPHLNGSTFLDKPILFYWIESAIIYVFGVHEWSARLLPAFFGVLGCLTTYWAGVKLYNRRTGLISALALMSMPLYFGLAHYTNMDLMVATLISCALWFFIIAVHESKKDSCRNYLLLMYLFSGLAFLTKGLIGLFFPAAIIGLWIIFTKEWRLLKEMHPIKGIIILIIIIAPWMILVQKQAPFFLYYFFYVQQVERFVTTGFNNGGPFYFYAEIVLLGGLPWTLFLFQALFFYFKKITFSPQGHKKELFMVLWFLFIFLFFSIPHSKPVGYILPVFIPVSMIIGCYLNTHWNRRLKKIFIALLLITIISEIAIIKSHRHYLAKDSQKTLALVIQQSMKPNDKVILYEDFPLDIPLYIEKNVYIKSNWNYSSLSKTDGLQHDLTEDILYLNIKSPYLIDKKTLHDFWKSKDRVFIAVSSENEKKLQQEIKSPMFILTKNNDYFLLSNRKK